MILDQELFEQATDDRGRERPALKGTVPQRVLRAMGLLTGETGGREEDPRVTEIPVKSMHGVRDWCLYTADFGRVEEDAQFPPPVQLVTIPCRSPTGDGNCTKMGPVRDCPLHGALSFVETPEKERVELIVVPIFPGTTLSPTERDFLVQKRERYQRLLRQREDVFAPVNMLIDVTGRSMQFWLRFWFRNG